MNDKLIKIQSELKAPKGQRNNFGNYNYRSCEDILEAVKPLTKKYDLSLVLLDEVVNIGTHNYIKSIAVLTNNEGENMTAVAYAREAETKKGMDDAQITGAASSYARKYALNGLFAIDDTKDADTQDNTQNAPEKSTSYPDGPPKTDKAKDFLASLKFQINGALQALAYTDEEKVAFVQSLINKPTIDTIEEAKELLNEVQALQVEIPA